MTMVDVVERMAGEVDALAGEVAGLDASAMASTMHAIGGLVAAAQRFEVRAAAHFTALGAFRAAGATSTAAWLRNHRRLGGGAAKQIEDAARAMSAVPLVRDAVERGAMSAAHAALLAGLATRVAAGTCPVDELLPLIEKAAELAVDRFRREVATVEVRLDAEQGHDPSVNNTVKEYSGDAGRKVWRAELDSASHGIIGNALQDLIDRKWRAGRSGKDSSGPPTSELARLRADALLEMAQRSLHGTLDPDGATTATAAGTADSANPSSKASDPAPAAAPPPERSTTELVVIIDWFTLRDEAMRHDSICRLLDGTPVSVETVRRLACDAAIIPAVLGAQGQVLDLGRSRRLASAAQHRALQLMYDTCAWPGGCDTPVHWCKAHHLDPWKPPKPGAPPGKTDLADLRPICERHHHLLHEGGWTLQRDPHGTLTLTPPGDPPCGAAPEHGPTETEPGAEP